MSHKSVEEFIKLFLQENIYYSPKDGYQSFAGLSKDILPVYLLVSFLRNKADILFISEDDVSAKKIYDNITSLYNMLHSDFISDHFKKKKKSNEIFFFPGWGIMPYHNMKPDFHYEAFRSKTLAAFENPEIKNRLIIASVSGIIRMIPEKDKNEEHNLFLKIGDEISRDTLLEYFEKNGYERVDIVESRGDFAVKGGIVDFYCPAYENPVRLEFFGDEIESIKFFRINSQLSIDKKSNIWVIPRRDLPVSEQLIQELRRAAAGNNSMVLPRFINEVDHSYSGLWDVYPLGVKTIPFPDLFKKTYYTFIHDSEKLNHVYDQYISEADLFYEKREKQFFAPVESLFMLSNVFNHLVENSISLTTLSRELNYKKIPVQDQIQYKGKISGFLDDLQSGKFQNKKVFFTSENNLQIDRISNLVENFQGENIQEIKFFEANFNNGFSLENCELFTENDIFGKNIYSRRIKKTNTEIIDSYVDIKEGDFIVHVNYGIGKFHSIKRMKAAGFERDFLVLEYAEEDKLYIPLEQLKYIHRYIGSSENIRLDYLGKKSSWNKTKKKVSESIEKLAEELISIYAEREKARGYSFKADTIYQEEFESRFPYNETDHQIMAIEEVKRDMESIRPMDRLICGDVGFGKTEVAIRAAFKAVMSGKQVAFLCPTTVLTLQHYNTFYSRLISFSIETDFLSRFKTSSELKKTKDKIKKGEIDIIIGTHALLSEDIEYRDLGLLIIDEEQKFGVKHKEKIKAIKKNVDCLTMTATPIPRTLHMSLSGLRDLSLIETPPGNRRKIETYVTEDNDDILVEAIRKELLRNGQIYILHNKVKTIDTVASRIHSLYPKASINILHGQMNEDEIEDILVQFYKHQFDILVTTTIIESGIDIPNVNTLIVLNSDQFGLSQLYQVKGRVGRSDRKAYAYFFYSQGKVLSETSQKRLNTLQEYDDLGSGFKIALKDLEIRGAGNLLGKEQSGDIMNVGFELYIDMLNEKMNQLKKVSTEIFESNIIIPNDYYIPDDYIKDTRQKMEIYKKISSSKTEQNLKDLEKAVIDRFGRFSEMMENIFNLEYIRILAGNARIDKIEKRSGYFSVTVSGDTSINIQTFQSLLSSDPRIKLSPEDLKVFTVIPANKKNPLKELRAILNYII